MQANKRNKLAAKGWKTGSTRKFLRLTPEEVAYIELRLKLAAFLKTRRRSRGISQTQLAQTLRSSQSRIAKMEAGDPSVSLDLLFKSLLALGATGRDLAAVIERN